MSEDFPYEITFSSRRNHNAHQKRVLCGETNFGLRFLIDENAWPQIALVSECCFAPYVIPRHSYSFLKLYICDECRTPCLELPVNDRWITDEAKVYSLGTEFLYLWVDRLLPPLEATLVLNSLEPILKEIMDEIEKNSTTNQAYILSARFGTVSL